MLRRVDDPHPARQRCERPAQHDALDQRPQRTGVGLVDRVHVRAHLLCGGRAALSARKVTVRPIASAARGSASSSAAERSAPPASPEPTAAP